MPPKNAKASGSSNKVKEDKTFGMKNKNKSAKVKQQVAQIQAQAAVTGKSRTALEKEKEKAIREKAKLEEEKRKKEEAAFFKPVQTQKVPFGVDPKTVLCVFFKSGTCEKGSKCKFSHDVNVGRKVEKKNLYEDTREEKLKDTMDTWDEEKLRSVVLSKTGKPRTTTDVCSASSYAAALIFCRSSANILFKPLKRKNSAGSGNVQMAKTACIDTPYRLALSLNLKGRLWKPQRKLIRLASKNSLKLSATNLVLTLRQ